MSEATSLSTLDKQSLQKLAAALRAQEQALEEAKAEKCAQVAIAAVGMEVLAQKLVFRPSFQSK